MNPFIIVLFVIADIIVLILIIALVSKKDYSIQRSINIHAPAQKVFNYVKYIKNQDNYNKWVMTDPAMQKIYKGIDGQPGFIYGWNGNKKAGEGEQEVKSVDEGKNIMTEVRFVRPFPGTSFLTTTTTPLSDNETRVDFKTESTMKFPMNIMIPMISGMLAKDMDITNKNLKKILEAS
ncbi:MAG: SRPBCC family protein [Ferruginibacter sp.]